MEYIVNQIVGYTKENKLEVMQNHIDSIIAQLPENHWLFITWLMEYNIREDGLSFISLSG